MLEGNLDFAGMASLGISDYTPAPPREALVALSLSSRNSPSRDRIHTNRQHNFLRNAMAGTTNTQASRDPENTSAPSAPATTTTTTAFDGDDMWMDPGEFTATRARAIAIQTPAEPATLATTTPQEPPERPAALVAAARAARPRASTSVVARGTSMAALHIPMQGIALFR